ncbi:Phyllosphere-induced regulator PhyR [Prosthecomicrobium hirschii]|uniref:Phyllosphere-induced regulator PhyR n=1 Tax=Prosthecodimorpha hirschii TaxID=665126 RepID=A0A0P6WD01_9HYPH|nr:response regulator [Prosthecomicrobium hirschii]KPL52587.1 Phyllosphere-induced regulator PhyR [Prosthecomicrobium hirschii]TPQ52496.1 response regulator [Prosthecomicrobium hirschii]
MNMKDRIGAHLPYLRRFARALSGSQQSGDAFVLAMLECLVEDPTMLRGDLENRTAIYNLFLRIWNSISTNGTTEMSEDHVATLAALTPRSRQAFLLVTLENFSEEEAAQVMDVEPSEFAEMIEEAGREIAEQVATDILIIEDEPIIAMDLEALTTELGHTVIDIARTQREALDIVARRRPGLVLADIQLADGSSGLDAVNAILETFEVPVIFVTAYPERLLTGTKPEPTYLVTKPFRPQNLKVIISQALFFKERATRKIAA